MGSDPNGGKGLGSDSKWGASEGAGSDLKWGREGVGLDPKQRKAGGGGVGLDLKQGEMGETWSDPKGGRV